MRFGISTACFYPQPVEEVLPILAGLGAQAIEIFFNTESEFAPSFYQRLGADAKKLGLDIVSVHPYTSPMEGMLLFSDYARRTEDGMAQYERYFTCAAALGARYFTFHGERFIGQQEDASAWKRKCEVYHRLCALATSCGVTLAQENVAWCCSRDPAFLRTLYRDVPELRYTLDIKQAFRADHHPNELIDAVGDRLVNIHINDYSEKQSCLLPGAGQMDYADLFSGLRAVGYQGDALIEVYRTDFAAPDELKRVMHLLSRIQAG